MRTEVQGTAGRGFSQREGSTVCSMADLLPAHVRTGVSAELIYDDVFSVWETIWAAKHVSSAYYVLFIALALVEVYRDIILENNVDFTDTIKFFNEMAERHNTKHVLKLARDLVCKVQTLIENK
ncbi:small G protein signaling modulator 1-like [Ursus maritimus]|uniref:Small G protein signaling modulator 1-like n=1 Tax=Ursus maritimus TaxID=29073 RepID=A0A8M1EX95_URSMA|nr:small G protein signaling modulator 1-like [Ursus maritimus]